MTNIVTISGGKDSEAVAIWAKNNLPDFDMVFCDTKWESPKTYAHIDAIASYIGKPIKVLTSKTYDGFIDLCIKKKRVPSLMSRYCTEELKVKPMIDYVLSIEDDVTVLQGVRNDESKARSALKREDEYFKFYFEPYGFVKKGKRKDKPLYHTYRKKDVLAHCDKYTVDVLRPIIRSTAQDVFDLILSSGAKANPLYYEGFGRVGCFPCINANLTEIRLIAEHYPERIDQIRELETLLGGTFFSPGTIPPGYCDRSSVNKKGERVYYATIDAIVSYVTRFKDQGDLFSCLPQSKCISVYNICETGN